MEELPRTRNGKRRARASTYFRMNNGTRTRIRRHSSSGNKAKKRLKKALSDLVKKSRGDVIQAEHRFVYVAEKWCKELDEAAELGGLSYNTVRTYRGSLKNWVLPALGNLQMREVTVTACDKLAKRALAQASYDTAKTVKAVMNGVCAYAVRHDAILINPVQSVGRLTRGGSKEVLALDRDQRKDLLSKLRDYGPTRQNDASGRSLGVRGQVWLDLPDIMEAMLSTGVRLGELLALHSPEVDPQAATVNVNHRLIRITGQGLVRQPHRKSSRTGLLLKVPQWSIPMWSSRKLASDNGPLFHSFTGEHLDPANVINRISEAMNAVGYGWVTSHVFRKTVGTVLDEAGLSTTAIADQLGNTRAVAERHYRRPRAANQANADALEDMM